MTNKEMLEHLIEEANESLIHINVKYHLLLFESVGAYGNYYVSLQLKRDKLGEPAEFPFIQKVEGKGKDRNKLIKYLYTNMLIDIFKSGIEMSTYQLKERKRSNTILSKLQDYPLTPDQAFKKEE